MRGSRRIWGLFIVIMLIAAMAVGLNRYADQEAEKYTSSSSLPPEQVSPPEVTEISQECADAQKEYDAAWDASVENPQDIEAEEKLEQELTRLLASCES